ncbi:MAG: DUF5721 family protein [bacterium]|nr:DUF5721 family protein [bacterium]MDY4099732.1 DUF5721 family protein [Lachnospiraceae bacterium]
MKAFYIKDQKQFMNRLLKSELFDHFLLSEATIHGAISYSVDGHVNREFFDAEELETLTADGSEYLPFSYFRPICFELIRGKHTPLYMKFVFLLSPENAKKTVLSTDSGFSAEDINGIFLNLTFRDGQMLLTTGVSYRTFTLDRSFDQAWDALAARFLSSHGIDFDVQ